MELQNIDLTKDFAMHNLFRKFDNQFKTESKTSFKRLRKSLEKIGGGEIKEKSEGGLMYKEIMKADSIILVIHADHTRSPYGGKKGYEYEIGVYRNNPQTTQIGGGYGASGIITIEHTCLFKHIDYDRVHFNRKTISSVCEILKPFIIDNF